MHGRGIVGALWSAGRRLASASGGVRAMITVLVLLLAGPLLVPDAARATLITETITGTVTSGTDTTGVFGASNGNLTGDSYILVYTADDTKGQQSVSNDLFGVPTYSTITSGSNYPTITNPTTAVLTINTPQNPQGVSYTYGTEPNGSTSSFITRNAAANYGVTSGVSENYTIPSVYTDTSNVSTFVGFTNPPASRNYLWSSPLSYTVGTVPTGCGPPLCYSSFGTFAIRNETGNPATGVFSNKQIASGTLNVSSITVGVAMPPPPPVGSPTSLGCIADIASAPLSSSLGGGSFSLQPTNISIAFAPAGGLSKAKTDCGLAGFDWTQTVTIPDPSYYYACGDAACTPANRIHITGTANDPPQYGWPYCYNTTCGNEYPDYYPAAIASSDSAAQGYCVDKLLGLCLAYLENDDTKVNFFDQPGGDVCLPFLGFQSPQYNAAACNNTTALPGSSLTFQTQLVGILADGSSTKLPYVIDWTDSYNGDFGGIGVLNDNDQGDSANGYGGIIVTSFNGVSVVPEPNLDVTLLVALAAIVSLRWRRVYGKRY